MPRPLPAVGRPENSGTPAHLQEFGKMTATQIVRVSFRKVHFGGSPGHSQACQRTPTGSSKRSGREPVPTMLPRNELCVGSGTIRANGLPCLKICTVSPFVTQREIRAKLFRISPTVAVLIVILMDRP